MSFIIGIIIGAVAMYFGKDHVDKLISDLTA